MVLAVQPLESWRELWVFHPNARAGRSMCSRRGSTIPKRVTSSSRASHPAPARLLMAREVKERGRFRRRFEELRLDDLALVRQASTPELLADFGRWQDVAWRRDTLALH